MRNPLRRKKKEKAERPPPFRDVMVILMLEAVRLEIRAFAEEMGDSRAALRSESDAISARVLGNG
ncbi:hypothetical protein LCGC14_1125780 [marine sediment metagenome]|uniref:Uncharacterized protein n=1 Tax=marine sediment metagenome TaxID=412755 RepID=A0A0F9M2P3_9ZZZZ